jgi:hypothetical protein
MHVRREDMYICVSSLLKYKIHLHLRDSVKVYLYYVTVKFKVQIYICIVVLEIEERNAPRYTPTLRQTQTNLHFICLKNAFQFPADRPATFFVFCCNSHVCHFACALIFNLILFVSNHACMHEWLANDETSN